MIRKMHKAEKINIGSECFDGNLIWVQLEPEFFRKKFLNARKQ